VSEKYLIKGRTDQVIKNL